MDRTELAAATDVTAVWQVMQQAREAGDNQLADAARRRLGELAPDNPRAVPPRQADAVVPLRRRVVTALVGGVVVATVVAVGLLVVGFGNIVWPGAGAGFLVGLALATMATEPNRVHHPDAGAESIMNYVRGEGGGGG